jgi:hypothetical protein
VRWLAGRDRTGLLMILAREKANEIKMAITEL